MATETVQRPQNDHGRDCKLSEVFDTCGHRVREERAKETAALVRNVGDDLYEIATRMAIQHSALELLAEKLNTNSDTDGEHGVVAMAIPYALQSEFRMFDLAAKVIVLLERAKMLTGETAEYIATSDGMGGTHA